MARTEQQIAQDLEDSILSSDDTLDVNQGPLPDIFIRPEAGQLAIASEEAESLRQLFTIQFEAAATDEEIRNALANYGSTPGEGKKASHIQYFMRFTKPTEDIEISAGTLVSNQDGSLVYRVVSGGKILASAASSYYNPNRGSYEIGLLTEAIGSGKEYELPRYRINTLAVPIQGIDSTENRTKSSGGTSAESSSEQADRLKTALKGINQGAPGGISSAILNDQAGIVTAVNVVQPFEKEFTRLTVGPALDVYVIGENYISNTETYVATGGETQIILSSVPVESVISLTINGLSGVIGYALVKDTTPESGYSLSSQDIVAFDSPLVNGDTVVIEYQYNKVLNELYTTTFADSEDYLFNTDILLRLPFPVNPVISGEVKALSSYSTSEVEDSVLAYLEELFTFTTFTSAMYPEVVRQKVITEVSGVQSFKITEFRRATGSLSNIEPMFFSRNERSVFDLSFINIRVIS